MLTYRITIIRRSDGVTVEEYTISVKDVADAAGHASRLRDVF